MGNAQEVVKTAVLTLAVIWFFNQIPTTRTLVQTALNGY